MNAYRFAGRLAGTVLTVMSTAAAADAADYHIGVIASLTGGASFIAQPSMNGLRQAVDELNDRQFLGPGNRLVVTIADDATDKNQSLALANRFAADPNILLVIGPTSGITGVPVAQLANEKKLPLWTGTNHGDVLKAGPWSFTFTEPADVSIPGIADYAVAKLGVKACAVVTIQDNEQFLVLARFFSDYAAKQGVKVPEFIGIKSTDTNFSAISVKVSALGADCVFVSAPAETGANVIMQMRQAGLDSATRVLGHNAFASDAFIKTGGQAVEGTHLFASWVPGGNNDIGRAFADAYRKRYGQEAGNWAAVGYTVMNLSATVVRNAGPSPTREAVREGIAGMRQQPVILGGGTYSRQENRTARYNETVMVVKDGRFVPAP